MPWVMSILKRTDPVEFHVYVGAVKIAEICFDRNATRWKCYLRLMYSYTAYDVRPHYESMSDALKDLHRLLNSPSPEGANVGYKVKAKTEDAHAQRQRASDIG